MQERYEFTGGKTWASQKSQGETDEHARILPRTIGPYTIENHLGQGATSHVYRARNEDTLVALKIPKYQSIDSNHAFKLEGLALKLAGPHQNIVGLIESSSNPLYLALEYLRGKTLRSRHNPAQYNINQGLEYAASIADALTHIHKRNIIHRDVKPGNIIIAHTPKLIDFGLALVPNAPPSDDITGGTIAYMAPEQCESFNEVGPSADIYSLGATVYELLTGTIGRKEVKFYDTEQLARHLRKSQWPRPSDINTSLDRMWDEPILKALHPDPDKRYASAAELKSVLLEFLSDTPCPPAYEPEESTFMSSHSSRTRCFASTRR